MCYSLESWLKASKFYSYVLRALQSRAKEFLEAIEIMKKTLGNFPKIDFRDELIVLNRVLLRNFLFFI